MLESQRFSECVNNDVLVASDGLGSSRDTPQESEKSGKRVILRKYRNWAEVSHDVQEAEL